MTYKEKRERIIAEYATTPNSVLAKKYGLKPHAVLYIAKKYGIKKDFAAQRAYKQAHKPPKPSDQRKEVIQQLIADYPYYSNVHLANKYHMTVSQVSCYAQYYHVHKDYAALRKVRTGRQKDILAEYSHRPTHELAAEMGLSEDTLRRRANRAGVHKAVRTVRPREKTPKERNVLAFSSNYTIDEISAGTGIAKPTIRAILRRNGITPKTRLNKNT